MDVKSLKHLLMLLFIVIFGTTYPANAENFYKKYQLNNTKVYTSKFNELYKDNNWVPLRRLLSPFVKEIYWNNKEKIAVVKNQGKELLINFSGKELVVAENQILVPAKEVKFANGKVYISGNWLGWIFDRYAQKGTDTDRDNLKEQLSFLNIDYIDIIPGIKDDTLHLFFIFKD